MTLCSNCRIQKICVIYKFLDHYHEDVTLGTCNFRDNQESIPKASPAMESMQRARSYDDLETISEKIKKQYKNSNSDQTESIKCNHCKAVIDSGEEVYNIQTKEISCPECFNEEEEGEGKNDESR